MEQKKSKKIPIIIGVSVVLVIAIIVVLVFVLGGHRVIKVESFSGAVSLERGSGEKDIVKGMNLKSEDTVTTGTDGNVELLVDEDKHILAKENTCFKIISKGDEKKGKLKIELEYGTSLVEIENKLEDGQEVELNTPNASLSVRGTTFETCYNEGEDTTVVKVTDGVVNVASGKQEMEVLAGNMATVKDDEIIVRPMSLEYIEEEAFDARFWQTKAYSGIHVKELLAWTTERREQNSNKPDELSNNGVRIRYWVLTEQEVNDDIDTYGSKGYIQSLDYLKNDDGDTMICLKIDFNGQNGSIDKAYEYYKKVFDDVYLSIMVYDENKGEFLAGSDIETYLPLTNNCYYFYNSDN